MKKPYNQTWVTNLYIQDISQSLLDEKLISDQQNEDIKINFPESFYKPGIFVKIGLFLFTLLGGGFLSGFISLFFVENGSYNVFILISLICSGFFFFLLEFVIKDRKLYHSGIDNALLYMGATASIIPVFWIFEHLEIWQYCLVIFIVNAVLLIRYADAFIAFVCVAALYAMFVTFIMALPQLKPLLPFCLMIVSAVLYFLNRSKRHVYYRNCQAIIEVTSLIIFYLGGNYYVVREGNAIIAKLVTPVAPQIPFATFFYFLTAIIPIVYCCLGLKRKDRILFNIGLLTIAFSGFTYRYYFQLLPIEIALPVLGGALILLATFLIHFLKAPKFGLSDQKYGKGDLGNIQAILVAHQFGQTPQNGNLEFGGGNFGGGGAGTEY